MMLDSKKEDINEGWLPPEDRPGYHTCVTCGRRAAKDGHDRCYACYRKRQYVYEKTLKAGHEPQEAQRITDESYPEKYLPYSKEQSFE